MTLSRRTFTLSTLALGLGALAGPARAAGETASITTSLGTYDIPRDPQRVVAIDFRLDVEPALALGLPVVGYGVQEERLDWVPLPADAAYVGGPPSREAIVGLDPDLIVCTDIPGSEYWPIDRLAPIAPTLPVDYELSWQANLTRMGEWLGRADRAAAFIADYQASVDAVRATHAAALAGGKLAAIWYEPDSSEVQVLLGEGTSNVTLAGQVLADLGGTTVAPEALGEYGVVSIENAGTVLAEVAGFLLDASEPARLEALESNPIWQRLPAVAAGRVYRTAGTFYGGGYSARRLVGEWARLLALLD
jgi:ABC-type Fe3+-hydroxamate transport system substrate-binding protein